MIEEIVTLDNIFLLQIMQQTRKTSDIQKAKGKMIDQTVSIITLNVNHLNNPIKRKGLKRVKKEDAIYITHTLDPKIQRDGK